MKKIFGFASMLVAFCTASVFTSCGEDDDDDVTEKVNLTNLVVKAKGDGNFTFTGSITANAKIKTFEIQDEAGKTVADLFDKNSQIKDKGEDGKEFTLAIESDDIKLDKILYLVVKTKGDKQARQQLTTDYDFEIGNKNNSVKGSNLSFIDEKVYLVNEAKANPAVIDALIDVDFSLKLASDANAQEIKEGSAKANIIAVTPTTGFVVSSNKLMASYEVYDIDGDEGKIKGYIISEKHINGLTVDVTNVTLQ